MYEGQRTLALSHEPNRIIEMVENHLHCHTEDTLFFYCSASLKNNGMTERLSKHPSSFCFKKDMKLNQRVSTNRSQCVQRTGYGWRILGGGGLSLQE